MKTLMNRRVDVVLAVIFALLTVLFIVLMITSRQFFDWAWARHHNVISWYIRPLALLPFMYFAYRRSFAGMSMAVFALATSMAWFPEPAVVSPDVLRFLDMEVQYLSQDITLYYVLLWLAVPLTFVLLAIAFWQRSFVYGGLVFLAATLLKMIWSVVEGGESATLLLRVATIGIIVVVGILYLSRKVARRSSSN